MRLVGVLPEEKLALQFSSFLAKEGIENHIEPSQSEDKRITFAIWIIEEDQFETALQHFESFQKDPQQDKYKTAVSAAMAQKQEAPSPDPEAPPEEVRLKPPPAPRMRYTFTMTGFFIMMCVIIYFLNTFQELRISRERGIKQNFLFTPIQKALMYDFPQMFIQLDAFIEKERLDLSNQTTPLSPELAEEVQRIEINNPYWKGFYTLILHHLSKKAPYSSSGPLFEKIRQGQIWRLFSPCILHRDLLHILFNMVWLWILGKQLDMRLNKWQYLFLVLIVGIVSNTTQYLMSGPLFMGFSGVITGMAGFIWVRQRVAPWEGYSIHRSTFIFLAFFIGVMFVLQAISFILESFRGEGFSVSIANTAHIVGALVGMLLARVPWLAWRPR